jgi:hypothetical protein
MWVTHERDLECVQGRFSACAVCTHRSLQSALVKQASPLQCTLEPCLLMALLWRYDLRNCCFVFWLTGRSEPTVAELFADASLIPLVLEALAWAAV